MERIDSPTAVPDMFGPGKPGITDGSVDGGVAATDMNSKFFNGVQESLVRVQDYVGMEPADDHEQFLNALLELISRKGSSFPAETRMLFQQSSAPIGWTKDVTQNDKALRIVSGDVVGGGTVDFSTAFVSKTVSGSVGATTLTLAQTANHAHTLTIGSGNSGGSNNPQYYSGTNNGGNQAPGTSSVGGGGSHTHSFTGSAIDLAVKYVDVIIGVKD